ncbi:GNAT family N-acetyltransferase [Pedobacter sp. SD-b]|uniref:GNAT family N-acetyltransferase n=1 Tax=Pedobacter segetis TaxID=2793069 RepID=A0ABS1BEQ1_9SPHI|nr:bifunctional GNAT family N-acetyltransferase/carbon-nitrogen hydrolase family protein [Pedobacter segetis]MBK0381348.1 GNAT family N-acetyltransferase [Pedobacter segetis]
MTTKNIQIETVELRTLRTEDYADLKSAMLSAYEGMGESYWREKSIDKLIAIFPEGQLCVEVNGKVVAIALSIIVDYAKLGETHTYSQAIGNYTFSTHTYDGDILYGIEVFVHPDYRGMRLARRLYDARKLLCENLNLKSIILGGRIPNYEKFAQDNTPRQYIDKVKMKEIYDPTLTFQISNDFHVRKILKNYLPEDQQSKEFATLLEWNNIYYIDEHKDNLLKKTTVRIGLVQWQMRLFKDAKDLMESAEYFVDAVSDYSSDFVVFPEFFNAPLMADYNHLGEAKAIRELAKHTEEIRNRFCELAVSYNVNIIAGSMPLLENDKLFNVSYLCRRDGTFDRAVKIHPTPSEIHSWGMSGGESLKVFDTDAGRIGILICYDAEFPELARLQALEKMDVLFVPFWTDTQNAYNRVRICSQARAIENECYVAITGSVGNLPKVNNMDLQYAQSAIFSPSDFAFPSNAIVAETTPNNENILIADVNLDLLKELHEHGSVKNLKDRRTDFYDLKLKKKP